MTDAERLAKRVEYSRQWRRRNPKKVKKQRTRRRLRVLYAKRDSSIETEIRHTRGSLESGW